MPVPQAIFYALVILNLLFVSGAWALARPSLPAAAVVAVVSVMWVLWNGPIEGGVLLSFSSSDGVTESDLLAVLGWVIAAVTVFRVRRRR